MPTGRAVGRATEASHAIELPSCLSRGHLSCLQYRRLVPPATVEAADGRRPTRGGVMSPSPACCSVCLTLLVFGCTWWILLGSSGLTLRGAFAGQRERQHRVVEQPTHISCPLGERTASALPGRVPADRRPDRARLRIATFNVEWLFDGVDDSPTFVPWHSVADANAHLQHVASAVSSLNADILNLVEVEGCFMLHRLIEALPQSRQRIEYVPYVVAGSDSSTRQQLGLLSRLRPTVALQRTEQRQPYPMPGSGCGFHGVGIGSKSTGVSKHYWTVFSIPGLGGKELLVVAAHLKARPNEPKSCAQREAQAAVLAGIVQEHGSNRHVVVMGDLNDFDANVPDSSKNQPNSNVIRQLSRDLGLHSVAARLHHDNRWSWQGEQYPRGLLDHILISPGLLPFVETVDLGASSEASDHRPLVVELWIPQENETVAAARHSEL